MKNTTMKNYSQEKVLLFDDGFIQLCAIQGNQILEERKGDKNIKLSKHNTNQIFTNHIQLTIHRIIIYTLITANITRFLTKVLREIDPIGWAQANVRVLAATPVELQLFCIYHQVYGVDLMDKKLEITEEYVPALRLGKHIGPSQMIQHTKRGVGCIKHLISNV